MRSSSEQAKFRKSVFHAHKKHDENGRPYLVCGRCGGKINPATEFWDADHIVVREFGGTEGQPLCKRCHRQKTSTEDIPAIAKSKRTSDRHYGIKKPRGFRKTEGSRFDWSTGRYERQK